MREAISFLKTLRSCDCSNFLQKLFPESYLVFCKVLSSLWQICVCQPLAFVSGGKEQLQESVVMDGEVISEVVKVSPMTRVQLAGVAPGLCPFLIGSQCRDWSHAVICLLWPQLVGSCTCIRWRFLSFFPCLHVAVIQHRNQVCGYSHQSSCF